MTNVASPYVPGAFTSGPAISSSGAQLGAGGAASGMGGAASGMAGLGSALLSQGISAGIPYAIQGASWLYDQMRGVPNIELGEQEKVWADLEKQMEEQNQEAIRRAQGASGQAVGGNLAMSGAAGLSSFNPVLAAMARQGEIQSGRVVSGLERQGFQDRSDYQSSRAEAINRQLAGMTGSSARKANVAEGYARASTNAGNLADAERYRAASSSVR